MNNKYTEIQKIVFIVKTTKTLPITWNLKEQRDFPVHEHYLSDETDRIISYRFVPTKNFDKDKFIVFMKYWLKKRYNANTVETID